MSNLLFNSITDSDPFLHITQKDSPCIYTIFSYPFYLELTPEEVEEVFEYCKKFLDDLRQNKKKTN